MPCRPFLVVAGAIPTLHNQTPLSFCFKPVLGGRRAGRFTRPIARPAPRLPTYLPTGVGVGVGVGREKTPYFTGVSPKKRNM